MGRTERSSSFIHYYNDEAKPGSHLPKYRQITLSTRCNLREVDESFPT